MYLYVLVIPLPIVPNLALEFLALHRRTPPQETFPSIATLSCYWTVNNQDFVMLLLQSQRKSYKQRLEVTSYTAAQNPKTQMHISTLRRQIPSPLSYAAPSRV